MDAIGLTVPWAGLRAAVDRDQEGVLAVLDVADRLGLDPEELAWIIERESGWQPWAVNPRTKAAGLIQWMPHTQAVFGMPDPASLTMTEQAPWIERFFAKRRIPPGDLYLATFYPAAVGKPDGFVIFEPGSKGWRQNAKALRESPEGPITAGSVRRAGAPPKRSRSPGALLPSGGSRSRRASRRATPQERGTVGAGWLVLLLLILVSRRRSLGWLP